MASVSVVGPGQHRSAPDHQLVFHKLKAAGRNKITLPWKSSVEIILGKSSMTRECCSVSAVSAVTASPLNPSLTPGQQGAAAGVGGGDPGVRREAQPDTGQSGRSGSGNDSTRDRRSSLKILTNVMSSTSANTQITDVKCDRSSAPTNGHMGAHSRRDRPVRRRASHSPNGQTTRLVTKGDIGGPPLERLTQGRTGVVKLARTESHRREVWSIFGSQEQENARVRLETGEGHTFGTRTVTRDWCDVCNQRISVQQALKCKSK
ncbi:unnamed protein product [Oncorhynchus mykiss]|uniref:Uncharacterized protein n=1 Tax=Oncorhynchus mykiss TaxID=8022 RepID=A0A060WXQ4_ONCMY|nr:unnamed protein product [Oncorhynchus mykiss]